MSNATKLLKSMAIQCLHADGSFENGNVRHAQDVCLSIIKKAETLRKLLTIPEFGVPTAELPTVAHSAPTGLPKGVFAYTLPKDAVTAPVEESDDELEERIQNMISQEQAGESEPDKV